MVEDIRKGEAITEDNVRSIRPGFGMHPMLLTQILNKPVSKNLVRGHALEQGDIVDLKL